MKEVLEWEVTPKERKERIKIGFKKLRDVWISLGIAVLLPIVSVILGHYLNKKPGFPVVTLIIIVPVSIIFLVSFIHVYRRPKETFKLTSKGVFKTIGTRSKFYPWDKFDEYYVIPYVAPSKMGLSISLIKRSNIFTRKYFAQLFSLEVVAEPDNYKEVEEFIKKHVKGGVTVRNKFNQ